MESKQFKKLMFMLLMIIISIFTIFIFQKETYASITAEQFIDYMENGTPMDGYNPYQADKDPYPDQYNTNPDSKYKYNVYTLDYMIDAGVWSDEAHQATLNQGVNQEAFLTFDTKPILDWHGWFPANKKEIAAYYEGGMRPAKGLEDPKDPMNVWDQWSTYVAGTACITPKVHEASTSYCIEAIMDVTETEVKVYLPRAKDPVVTKIDITNPDKDYAHQLAYFSAMANALGETVMDPKTKQISANASSYQYLIRFSLFRDHWTEFHDWGIPDCFDPLNTGYPDDDVETPPATIAKYQQALAEYKQKVKEGKTYIGRYIFLNGEATDTGGFGQNNMIITGYERDAGSTIEIQKKSKDTGEAMPGVQFTVQSAADNRYFNADGKLSNEQVVLTTDAQGMITIKNKDNSGAVKAGMEVYITEVGMDDALKNQRI